MPAASQSTHVRPRGQNGSLRGGRNGRTGRNNSNNFQSRGFSKTNTNGNNFHNHNRNNNVAVKKNNSPKRNNGNSNNNVNSNNSSNNNGNVNSNSNSEAVMNQLRSQRDRLREEHLAISQSRLSVQHQHATLQSDVDQLRAKNFCNAAAVRRLEILLLRRRFEFNIVKVAVRAMGRRETTVEAQIEMLGMQISDAQREFEANGETGSELELAGSQEDNLRSHAHQRQNDDQPLQLQLQKATRSSRQQSSLLGVELLLRAIGFGDGNSTG